MFFLSCIFSWTIVERHDRDCISCLHSAAHDTAHDRLLISIVELYRGVSCTRFIHAKNGNTMLAYIIAVLYHQRRREGGREVTLQFWRYLKSKRCEKWGPGIYWPEIENAITQDWHMQRFGNLVCKFSRWKSFYW